MSSKILVSNVEKRNEDLVVRINNYVKSIGKPNQTLANKFAITILCQEIAKLQQDLVDLREGMKTE